MRSSFFDGGKDDEHNGVGVMEITKLWCRVNLSEQDRLMEFHWLMFQVSIYMPQLKVLRNVVDKMKNLSNYVVSTVWTYQRYSNIGGLNIWIKPTVLTQNPLPVHKSPHHICILHISRRCFQLNNWSKNYKIFFYFLSTTTIFNIIQWGQVKIPSWW